jgi:ATP-binding protein involved in chromosome partitioning
MTSLVSMVRFLLCRLQQSACTYAHGNAGARRKCAEMGIKLLGDIPLHPEICTDADAGMPTVVAKPSSPQAEAFTAIARQLKLDLGID